MPICRKCEGEFPNKIRVNGKEHNLQNRKFCLKCSPFGSHNTRKLDEDVVPHGKRRVSGTCGCGRRIQEGRSLTCYVCYQHAKTERVRRKVYGMLGTACWRCEFDAGFEAISVLDFHHMDEKTKLFTLQTRNMCNRAWDVVLEEMKKCCLLCCRCHRLFHAGLVSADEIKGIHERKWKEIEETGRSSVGLERRPEAAETATA